MPERIEATLVAGGKYHDIDFARRELLGLLGEHDHVRVTVLADYEDVATLTASAFIVSYTCDVRPSNAAQEAVADWVSAGGRWLALHGTNAALDLPRPDGVEAPRCFPRWAEVLGSQFIAHPPIMTYPVEIAAKDHWLVADIEPFDTDDELYLMEHVDRDALAPLLWTHWTGTAHGFAESDWSERGDEHLISYLREFGEGAVLYNTLGHCRGHWDMVPLTDYFPDIERGSWDKPQFYELLRRGIRWAMGDEPEAVGS